MFRYLGDIASKRQYLCACGHNMVCCNIVSYLYNHLPGKHVFRRLKLRQRFNIRSSYNFNFFSLFRRQRRQDHIIVYNEFIRHINFREITQFPRIGKVPGNSSGGGRFGADKIYLGICRSASSFKIPVECAHGYRAGAWGTAHADAGAASVLQYSRPGSDNVKIFPASNEVLNHLPGTGTDRNMQIFRYRFPFQGISYNL